MLKLSSRYKTRYHHVVLKVGKFQTIIIKNKIIIYCKWHFRHTKCSINKKIITKYLLKKYYLLN